MRECVTGPAWELRPPPHPPPPRTTSDPSLHPSSSSTNPSPSTCFLEPLLLLVFAYVRRAEGARTGRVEMGGPLRFKRSRAEKHIYTHPKTPPNPHTTCITPPACAPPNPLPSTNFRNDGVAAAAQTIVVWAKLGPRLRPLARRHRLTSTSDPRKKRRTDRHHPTNSTQPYSSSASTSIVPLTFLLHCGHVCIGWICTFIHVLNKQRLDSTRYAISPPLPLLPPPPPLQCPPPASPQPPPAQSPPTWQSPASAPPACCIMTQPVNSQAPNRIRTPPPNTHTTPTTHRASSARMSASTSALSASMSCSTWMRLSCSACVSSCSELCSCVWGGGRGDWKGG